MVKKSIFNHYPHPHPRPTTCTTTHDPRPTTCTTTIRQTQRRENFSPVRNPVKVSCKLQNDHKFRCEIGLPVDWNG